jgi:catalase-peroxidase
MSADKTEANCPFNHAAGGGTSIRDWWPNRLRLNILRQHSSLSSPMGESFNYAEEFKSLDLQAVKTDLRALMTD